MKTEIEVRKSEFQKEITTAFGQVLTAMEKWGNVDPKDDNFKETADRVGKAYIEILDGLFDDGEELKAILSKTFPAKSDEMVIVDPIKAWSFCPHHLLPVEMKIWIAYIPRDKVLGLSKLARLSELMAKKPALQEDTTVAITEALQDGLAPRGAACLIKGRHLCMVMRGAKQDVWTTTTCLRGAFLSNPETRAEFLAATREKA
jgi:GTP cyclohydrolase IA